MKNKNHLLQRNERRSFSIFAILIRSLFGISLLLIQLAIYYFLIFGLFWIPYITLLSYILCLVVVTKIYSSDKNPSYKLTWTIVCFMFSVSGPMFYLLFGTGSNFPKKKNDKIMAYLDQKLITNDNLEKLKLEDSIGYKHAKLLHYGSDGYPLYDNTPNVFFKDGLEFYNDMVQKIKDAKKFIFLEFFIIGEGELFNELFPILTQKAKDGVEVKVIYDAIGSGSVLRKKTVRKLNLTPNFKMIPYNPFGKDLSFTVNYRDHRKIVVIDGLYSYVGGLNLDDEYIHKTVRFGHWRDNGMLLEGRACHSFTLLFAQNWYMSTKEMLVIEDYKPVYPEYKEKGYVFGFGDGPTNHKNPAYDMFLSLINNAKESIYISTPYFVIDSQFIAAITQAIHSGIDVKIMIPGIPDKKSVFRVTQAHMKNILFAGGEVYEYTPGFNHAKNIVVDGKYAFVGTVNLDYRSLFLHFECGNLMMHTDSIKDIEQDFLDTIKECKLITVNEWRKRPLVHKLLSFIVTILGPLI
ncbi:MAG: cardiolipin synthase [bacterium]